MTVLLAVVLWAIAEVAVLVEVAEAIGVLPAVVLLLVISASGPWLVRRVGLGVWRRTRDHLRSGQPPGADALDGMALVVGGVLVTVPGFIGDAVGLAILLPPVRALVRRLLLRRFGRAVIGGLGSDPGRQATGPGRRGRRATGGGRPPGDDVIDVDSHPGAPGPTQPGHPPGGTPLDPPR